MRFSLFLALILAGLSVAASAQQPHHKTRVAPSRHAQEKKKGGGAITPEAKPERNSAAEQLSRAEHEGMKTGGAGKQQKLQKATLPKAEHEKPTPPIRFSSAGGNQGGLINKGTNPYKGRLRQKGGSHNR